VRVGVIVSIFSIHHDVDQFNDRSESVGFYIPQLHRPDPNTHTRNDKLVLRSNTYSGVSIRERDQGGVRHPAGPGIVLFCEGR